MVQRQSPLELRIPPVAQALLLATAMWLLAKFLPGYILLVPARILICVVLVAAGGAIGLAGLMAFSRAKTTVDPLHPHAASELVVVGVFRWTRNPMYFGLLLALAAWAVYLGHLLALALLPVFVLYMNRYQIRVEERAMLENFGPQYQAYMQSVRRWI
jgi:protein-S-isoprenylcysteine O-methyltransferase Ste14